MGKSFTYERQELAWQYYTTEITEERWDDFRHNCALDDVELHKVIDNMTFDKLYSQMQLWKEDNYEETTFIKLPGGGTAPFIDVILEIFDEWAWDEDPDYGEILDSNTEMEFMEDDE